MALSEYMQSRIQKLEERDAELMKQLTLPVLQDEYPGRHIEPHTVQSITDGSLMTAESTGCGVPADLIPLLPVGKVFGLEIRGGSQITGWLIDGAWHHRKSDDDLQTEHEAWLAKAKKEHLEFYEANKELWNTWVEELPEWVDPKGQFKNPSKEFIEEFMGFGYALTAARMAPMYAALGDVILDKNVFSVSEFESDEIKEFSRKYGTSGNQHGWALGVAQRHLNTELGS